MRAALFVLTLVTFSTGCYYYPTRAGISDAVITNDPDAVAAAEPRTPPPASSVAGHVLRVSEARVEGGVVERVVVPFGPNQDGTQLIADFLGAARNRSAAASDVHMIFVVRQGVECRIGVQPEGAQEPMALPAGAKLVAVPAARTLEVLDHERRCGTQYDCSRPTARTPYQRSVDCRVIPASRPPTWDPEQARCRTEPVTHTVTRYDFEIAASFLPPHFEELQKGTLVETEPVCYALPAGTPPSGNRLEGTLHFRR